MSDVADHSIYLHSTRPEWGGAVIAWERDGKRGYQFEDGRLRVFTSGHYHLLEPIDASADRRRTLRGLLGLPAEADIPVALAHGLPAELPTLDEQIAYFRTAYPGGFSGTRWRADHRGENGRARKRHREPAIALAQKELTAAQLADCLERRREDEGMETLASVLARTDLVPSPHVQGLASLPPNRARVVIVGLFDLLFGRSSAEVRIVQWVHALARGTGKRPGWALATAPLALLFPNQHVCVHRASFAAQASSMDLGPRVAVSPSGVGYPPLLAMAERVRARLKDAGLPPADLLDVHDFMVSTLRADALRAIAQRR